MAYTADVVVVGAGMAGAEAAAEIAAHRSARVLVADGSKPPPALRWQTAPTPHYPDRQAHLGPGGRSLAWHGVVLRLEPWALAEWPPTVAGQLRSHWYPLVEHDLQVWSGHQLDHASATDAALVARLSQLTGVDWQPVPQAVRYDNHQRRSYTPMDRWRPRTGRPEMVSGTVTDVIVHGGRVTGVRLGNNEILSTPTVLLAAGTLETTRLLARTRRRPRQAYPLADHLVEGLLSRLPPGTLPEGGFARWPADPEGRCSIFARTHAHGDSVILDTWTMGEQLPKAASRMLIEPSNPARPVQIQARLSPADEEVLAAGRNRLEHIWASIGTGRPPAWPPFLDNPRSFPQAMAEITEQATAGPVPYAWPLGTVDHESSTLPLGSELNDDGQAMDIPGLWVTGPAVFPRPGAANPSLTTLALARRTARLLTQHPTTQHGPSPVHGTV